MDYTFIANLASEVQVPANGILSRTLYNDERLKVVLFGFSEGQELSAHTAPMPAVIQILEGEAELTLGQDKMPAAAGAFIRMPPQLNHGIMARTPLKMLLLMMK